MTTDEQIILLERHAESLFRLSNDLHIESLKAWKRWKILDDGSYEIRELATDLKMRAESLRGGR